MSYFPGRQRNNMYFSNIIQKSNRESSLQKGSG